MKCNQIKPLLDEFVEGELMSPQREIVEKHLEVCPTCRDEVSALRRTLDLIAEFGEVKEPPDFLTRVRERLESPAKRSLFARLTERPLIARAIVSVACVMLVAMAGWVVYKQLSPAPPLPLADRKPAPPEKPERIALVRSESDRPILEAGRELDGQDGRIKGTAPSHMALGEEESRAGETVADAVPYENKWAEVRDKANREGDSEYFYTKGAAYDAVVALSRKAGQGAPVTEEPLSDPSHGLFNGEGLAVKKKEIELGALSSLDADTDQKDSFGSHAEPAAGRLSSAGNVVSQEPEPTSRMGRDKGGRPSAQGSGSGLEETQERLGAFSIEAPPLQDSQYRFLNGVVGKEELLPLQPPLRLRGVSAAEDEYKAAMPNEEQKSAETADQAGTGVRATEGVQHNQPQLGKELEESPPDEGGIAHLWLRQFPSVDDDATVSGGSGLLERRNEGAYGRRVPEFLLTVPNRQKALDEISRFVADLGGEARNFSQQEILARGFRFGEEETLVIILPRVGYERFQKKFPIRPAERGRIFSESESRPSRQAERRRAQSGETVTFILRVNESSPRRPSPETAP